MIEIKLVKQAFISFFILLFLNLQLIKSRSLCPFEDKENKEDLINYFVKGIIPNLNKSDEYFWDYKDFTWEFIHCINNYSLSTYLITDNGEDFSKQSGIFIGSSIDLGKLSIDFINTNLTLLSQETRDKLIAVSGKFGEEAKILYNSTGNFELRADEIDIINEKVYSFYFTLMQNYYGPEKIKSHSLEMCLFTFFVKFYGINSYLEETKNYVGNEQLYMLAFYFLNLNNENYYQNKLWTLIALSSTPLEYNYHHICFYIDSKVRNEIDQKNLKLWLKNYVSLNPNLKNLYTIGNYTNILPNEENSAIYNYSNFIKIIENYEFDMLPYEDINDGIKKFEDILQYNKHLFNGKYYQRHLVIILNSPTTGKKIKLNRFHEKGINVILLFRISKNGDYYQMNYIFQDIYNRIPFSSFVDLNKDYNYTLLLNSRINFYIETFNYIGNTIEINNITTIKKDNIQCFNISYDDYIKQNNIINKLNEDNNKLYYFHISLIYNNEKEIKHKFGNNANITFFISPDNPYTDIKNYQLINFCFNTTVSSDFNKSPFINYVISKQYFHKNNFYITIVGNDLDYSLKIELLNETNFDNFVYSNGLYGSVQVHPNASESIATFSEEKCIKKLCKIDYISLVKYFVSGIHFNKVNDNDLFDKIFDLKMFECLYKNYYCPFFNIDQKGAIYNLGPYIGYGLDLSKTSPNDLFTEYIPLYIINKLDPFLSGYLDDTSERDKLDKYNLILTHGELLDINMNYLRTIFQQTQRLKYFDEFSDNIKIALFLRATELGGISGIKFLDELHAGEQDKYLNSLMKAEKTRTTSFESLNFQMLLIQATKINKLKKCLVSLVVGKSLLYSNEFIELINRFNNYRISLSYYDPKTGKTNLIQYFTEKINDIKKKIYSITNNSTSPEKMDKIININSVLKQQLSLFKTFDFGVKKTLIIVSTHSNDTFKYEFNPSPKKDLLEKLNELNINIFDYSDKINFVTNNGNENDNNNIMESHSYDFYNSQKSEYIQYVPYLDYFDMSNNYVTLSNIINKYPIPINKIKHIILDLDPNEEIIFEFDLQKEKEKLKKKNYLDKYNNLKFSFEPSNLDIYFSRNFPFPNNHSYDLNYSFDKEKGKYDIYYELKYIFENHNNSKFYMTIKSPKKVDDLFVDLELCDYNKKNCMKKDFYFKFYIGFICVGIVIFFYGIYICFCEITFKKESNIFDIK